MTDQQHVPSAAALSSSSCLDDTSYVSKVGLSCAQHELLDCNGFVHVGFNADEVQELLQRCPTSCRVPCAYNNGASVEGEDMIHAIRPLPMATEATTTTLRSGDPIIKGDQVSRQAQSYPWTVQGNIDPRGSDGDGGGACFPGWDETCRDDPSFLADDLFLPCDSFKLLQCTKLEAIGFDERQLYMIVNSCPCSCEVECGTWTMTPTEEPSTSPTVSHEPTSAPSSRPSMYPSQQPSHSPTALPSFVPTSTPSVQPTSWPTKSPSKIPTASPSLGPTRQPSAHPTPSPVTSYPTYSPTPSPVTSIPTTPPTHTPSSAPSNFPTSRPSISLEPSLAPSVSPTHVPTTSMKPSAIPSASPSVPPSVSAMPTSSDYWAAATVWQENKEGFMSLIIIFGAAAITLVMIGVFSVMRMKKIAPKKSSNVLHGKGSSGKEENPSNEESKRHKPLTQEVPKQDKSVRYIEPNIQSDNARVPKSVYARPGVDQPATFDDLEALVDNNDPATGWLDNYALRHQRGPVTAIRPKYTDDFATHGTVRSSAATLRTNTICTKVSNGSGHGSVVVFEAPKTPKSEPKQNDAAIKQDRGLLLGSLPFVRRDRTRSTQAMSTAESYAEGSAAKEASGDNCLDPMPGKSPTAIQYVVPPPEDTIQDEKKVKRTVFRRWTTGRGRSAEHKQQQQQQNQQQHQQDGIIALDLSKSGLEADEQIRVQESQNGRGEKKNAKPVFVPVDKRAAPQLSVDTTRREEEGLLISQEPASKGTQLPAWLNNRGAWLPTTMVDQNYSENEVISGEYATTGTGAEHTKNGQESFAFPTAMQWTSWLTLNKHNRQDPTPLQLNNSAAVPSVGAAGAMDSTNTTQPELQWSSWIPQLNPAEATARPNGRTIGGLEHGDKRATAARTGGGNDTRNHFAFPQIEWPVWMATDHAEPSDLTKARQQASIMPTSPTTEDGIGTKPSNKRASKSSKW
eukprot:CAMPEP_0178492056 /NCGR_PEP_ID=MMETSP0696-20121128/11734_1 /TAXON_ID=265572 /ORGANISM="Extubocellulus spinifer, Strain CCMP396" /LENGTH=961 /DNA_ID=CAMNT_0020119955 /DNA_START=26 /DNA_END=2908 /DNA_ORIENTATION=+